MNDVRNTLVIGDENAGDLIVCYGILRVEGKGRFPDMSSYFKLNRLGPHYKSSKSVMGI